MGDSRNQGLSNTDILARLHWSEQLKDWFKLYAH